MKNTLIATLVALFSVLPAISDAKSNSFLLLTNAQVYTVSADRKWAEAVAINADGVIADVGSSDALLAAYPNAQVVDLQGRMVLPGFQDVHLHAVEAGISENFCEMPQFGDENKYLRALRECAAQWTGGKWVMGAGVNMSALLESVSDPLKLIDTVFPERPVIIIDDIGHGAWANSLALAHSGFDEMVNDPAGGFLIRQANGQLSGVVLESLSQTLMDAAQPPTPVNMSFASKSLLDAMATLAKNGITSVSDAGGYWPRAHEQIWAQLEANGELTVRASNALYVYPDKPADAQIAELKKRLTADPSALVRFNQVKIYVDGILTQATGALNAPYESGLELDTSDARGLEYFPKHILFRYARELAAAGFQLHFHTTGDRGTALALDAIAQSDSKSGPHRITHLYMIAAEDIARFVELGVVADFQIAPSSVDDEYIAYLSTFIGNRAKNILPLRSLYDAGATITLSSDWDADELSPLVKLETVLTRQSEGAPNLAAAIEMMTINPAKLLKHANMTGSIEAGKFADLVILDQNLFDLELEALSTAKVEGTLFQGAPVYDPLGLFK